MAELEVDTFVRVLAKDANYGKLGIVVKPNLQDRQPFSDEVYVEMADPDPFGGVYRVLYHVSQLREVKPWEQNRKHFPRLEPEDHKPLDSSESDGETVERSDVA